MNNFLKISLTIVKTHINYTQCINITVINSIIALIVDYVLIGFYLYILKTNHFYEYLSILSIRMNKSFEYYEYNIFFGIYLIPV